MTAFRRQVDECHPLIPGYTDLVSMDLIESGFESRICGVCDQNSVKTKKKSRAKALPSSQPCSRMHWEERRAFARPRSYIPLRFYRIGTSFGSDSVCCVNEFRDVTQRKNQQTYELRHAAATTPQLPPLCSNEETINVLDDYNYKHHPNVLGPVETKRSLLEPPIPGWTGFVPRSRVTEFGHGVRYHVMAENCYQDFKDLLERSCHDPASMGTRGEPHVTKTNKGSRPQQRFYRPEGMLPKYTGHIPHERSGIGRTFGNISRSCSVCNHMDENYGAYLAKKRKAEKNLGQMVDEKKAINA